MTQITHNPTPPSFAIHSTTTSYFSKFLSFPRSVATHFSLEKKNVYSKISRKITINCSTLFSTCANFYFACFSSTFFFPRFASLREQKKKKHETNETAISGSKKKQHSELWNSIFFCFSLSREHIKTSSNTWNWCWLKWLLFGEAHATWSRRREFINPSKIWSTSEHIELDCTVNECEMWGARRKQELSFYALRIFSMASRSKFRIYKKRPLENWARWSSVRPK